MPALSVSLDGETVATINTDGYDVLAVRVHGTMIDEEIATLECSGGSYPQEGEKVHLVWINERPLKAGQIVAVSLQATGATNPPGQTIEELFPDSSSTAPHDFTVTSEMVADLRSRPRLREKCSFRITSTHGEVSDHETSPGDHGFTFMLLWNSFSHPERARVSLTSSGLDSVETRGPMNDHFKKQLGIGDVIRFQLL